MFFSAAFASGLRWELITLNRCVIFSRTLSTESYLYFSSNSHWRFLCSKLLQQYWLLSDSLRDIKKDININVFRIFNNVCISSIFSIGKKGEFSIKPKSSARNYDFHIKSLFHSSIQNISMYNHFTVFILNTDVHCFSM